MSPKIPVVKAREIVRVAQRVGFVFDRQKGSHAVYYREVDKLRVVIPMHSGRDVKPRTLAGIIADMNLTIDEFVGLL